MKMARTRFSVVTLVLTLLLQAAIGMAQQDSQDDPRREVERRQASIEELQKPASADGQAHGTSESPIGSFADYPGRPPAGPGKQPKPPLNRIEGVDVLLIETKDGLSAYSKSLGTWDRIVIGLPKSGSQRIANATVSHHFASVIIDDQLFGFSSRSGRWSKLKIPAAMVGKVQVLHGLNLLSVEMEGETFVLSPTTHEWTSSHRDSTSPPKSDVLNFVDGGKIKWRPGDPTRLSTLQEAVAEHDAKAARLADEIRTLTKANRDNAETAPQLEKLREALDSTLTQAFEFKDQIERARIKEMESRLQRLSQQIRWRKEHSSQIIARRARELIDGKDTEWNDEKNGNSNAGQSSGDAVNVTSAPGKSGNPFATRAETPNTSASTDVPPETPQAESPKTNDAATYTGDQASPADLESRRTNQESSAIWPIPHAIPPYKDLATDLANAFEQLEDCKAQFTKAEKEREKKIVDQEYVGQVKRYLDSATRRYTLLLDDYRAIMHDLELQLKEASIDVNAATRFLAKVEAMYDSGRTIPIKTVDDAKHRADLAKSALERLQARYELYKKATDFDPQNPLVTDAEPSDIAIAGWGLRMKAAAVKDNPQFAKTKYRGGLRIQMVALDRPAAKTGIQKDDILVGLDKWETMNSANVTWIINQVASQPGFAERGDDTVIKFYILRAGELKVGHLPVLPVSRPNAIED